MEIIHIINNFKYNTTKFVFILYRNNISIYECLLMVRQPCVNNIYLITCVIIIHLGFYF